MAIQSKTTSSDLYLPTGEYNVRSMRARLRAFSAGQYIQTPKAFFHIMSERDAYALSSLINWAAKFPHLDKTGGWFFFTIEDFELETGMNQDKQERTFKYLLDEGYIKKKRMGMPPKRYFQINMDIIEIQSNEVLDWIEATTEQRRTERQAERDRAIREAGLDG